MMMKNTLKTLSRFAVCLMMIGAVACSDDEPGGGGPGGGEGGGIPARSVPRPAGLSPAFLPNSAGPAAAWHRP